MYLYFPMMIAFLDALPQPLSLGLALGEYSFRLGVLQGTLSGTNAPEVGVPGEVDTVFSLRICAACEA